MKKILKLVVTNSVLMVVVIIFTLAAFVVALAAFVVSAIACIGGIVKVALQPIVGGFADGADNLLKIMKDESNK